MKNKKTKIIFAFSIIVIFSISLIIGSKKIINSNYKSIKLAELPDNYKSWLELSDEEKSKNVRPLAYEVSVNKNKNVKKYVNKNSSNYDTIPDTYDLRVYNGVKPVKNQRNWGFCWAFAGTSSLESHMLSETRNSMIESCTDIGYDLNPMHVGYALSYNFKYDIKNLYGNRPLNFGGNNIDTIMYWTSGIGPVSTDKFTVTSESLPVELPANEILVQTENIKVDNVKMFPEIDIKNASNEEKNNYISLIKQTLVNNGALAFGSMAPVEGASGYNSDNKCVYTETINEVYSASHMMLIVGWDDNFSKDNFNPGVSTGQKPSIDGAWIVQNSWGTGSNLGVDGTGYYYYSYEDYGLNNEGEIMSVEKTSNKGYDNIYQYNPSGEVRPSTGKYAANVFSKDKNSSECLTEVSFYNFYPDTTYSIYVNPDNDDIDISKLECVKTYTDTNSFSEYVTVKLDEPIELTGEKFAVILKADNNVEQFNLPILTNASESMTDEEIGIKENQSFVSNNGKNWIDTKNQFNATVLIKAFTSNLDETVSISSSLDKDKVSLYGTEQAILLTSKTKNISNVNLMRYEILDSNGIDVTSNFNISISSNDSTYYANILVPFDYSYIGKYTLNVKYDGEVKSENSFEIEKLLISDINLLREDIYLEINGNNNIIPKIEFEPHRITNPEFVFESNDSNIATVTNSGIVTGRNVGNTKIVISSTDGSNISKELNIHVVDLNNLLDGSGTKNDPYLIKTADDLNLVKANLLACYKLNNDIDLSNFDGKGFEPIGFLQNKFDDGSDIVDYSSILYAETLNNSDIFVGKFDGDNHVISGLNINRPNEKAVALFSIVKNGEIKNLKIRNSNIRGNCFVSSVSAISLNETIENVCNDSDIELYSVGGGITAIANNGTVISKSYNRGNIIQNGFIEDDKYYAGYIGGIAGIMHNSNINLSFNSGNIKSINNSNSPDAGGIVGSLINGNINNSYNIGDVSSAFCCGGIVGEIFSNAEIKKVYNTGVVSANSSWKGDITGLITVDKITIDNVYALESDINATGSIVEIEDNVNSIVNISVKTLDEMKNKDTYVGFDFDNIWSIEPDSLPVIKSEIPRLIEGIKIKTLPTKLEYLENEDNIDLSGIDVVLYYTDGSEEKINITPDMISGFDTSSEGEKSITINYDNYTATFKINVIKNKLKYLSVSSKDKYRNFTAVFYQFMEGESFDFTKVDIYAIYENNESKKIDLNECSVSKYDALSTTDTKITVTFTEDGITVSYDIGITVYPKLNEFFEGEGTKDSPYLVSTAEQLNKVRENKVACYKLINDIDMTDILSENGELYNNGEGWIPISDDWNRPFEGDFDGDNHKIIGLKASNNQLASTFGIVLDATIENLILENANFSSPSSSGFAENSISSNLYNLSLIDSEIKSDYAAGGISSSLSFNSIAKKCCVLDSKISTTYSDSSSDFGPAVGGITASMSEAAIIEDCYNTSEIIGYNFAGGICGALFKSPYGGNSPAIKNTYNIGEIKGEYNVGGIVSSVEVGTIDNCYDLNDEVNAIAKIADDESIEISNVIEKGIEELKQKSTFVGFDFENVWKINEDETPSFISKNIESISLKAPLTKLTYNIGENLDVTGGKLIVTYSDNTFTEVDLTMDMISGFDNTKPGEQEITVSYLGKETTFKIKIIELKNGDINKDGRINVNDLNYGLRGLTRNTLTDEEKEIGDVNGDNKFNVNDLNKMLRYLVGKINSLD